MKNKKAEFANLAGIFVAVVIVTIIFVTTAIIFDGITQEKKCVASCNELNKEFFNFKSRNIFTHEECWCKINDSTIQIW